MTTITVKVEILMDGQAVAEPIITSAQCRAGNAREVMAELCYTTATALCATGDGMDATTPGANAEGYDA